MMKKNKVKESNDVGVSVSKEELDIFTILKYFILFVAAIAALLPISTVVIGSLKTGAEFSSTSPFALPTKLNFDNYVKAFTEGKMLRGFFNTTIQLIFISIGSVFTGTMTAFILHRFDFKLRKAVLNAFLLITLIPGVVTNIATFQIINFLGVYNTRLAGILLGIGTDIIAVYIYLQFLDNISPSLDEAAIIDGASYLTVYSKIILPLLRPATITVLIIKCVGVYNDFYTPYLYMPKMELQTISTALFKFQGPYGSKWEIICAGIVIAGIPTMIAFLALQKQIYNGLVQGSVKQ